MMEGYIGEKRVPLEESPFADFGVDDWVLLFIEKYGGIHGDHHKTWVLDQVARILNGTEIEVKVAAWENGYTEWRIGTGEASDEYRRWVKGNFLDGDYDTGIAP